MSFELTNAPSTFMTLMNSLICKYLNRFTFVFMNDILIYSKCIEEHKSHLKQVFNICELIRYLLD